MPVNKIVFSTFVGLLILLGTVLWCRPSFILAAAPQKTTPQASLRLEQKAFPDGTLYSLRVPAGSPYQIAPVLSEKLAGIEAMVWKAKKPLFIINGGFFDPQNSLTTSYVSQDGALMGDPRLNPRLVDNPKLAPYLPKIFDRSEFRVYQCQADGGLTLRYDITRHSAETPKECRLQSAIGAGPVLLPQVTDYEEGFVDYNTQGKVSRDPIGVCAKNARSAVGLTEQGDVILVMGAQDPAKPKNSGFNLQEMASLLKSRGAVKALALDGGSSSGIWYQGKPFYGKFNADASPVKRPVKSVLMVIPR
ncbi:MAG TPA: phosphodiester glycosidase family protein [Coleofasciculaceae cyanobacterium]|jgi:hypothetical protein